MKKAAQNALILLTPFALLSPLSISAEGGDGSNGLYEPMIAGDSPFVLDGFVRQTVHGMKSIPGQTQISRDRLLSSQTRFRVGAEYDNNNLKIDIEGNLDLVFGNFTDTLAFDYIWGREIRNRWMSMERSERRNDSIVSRDIHRAFASYSTDTFKLAIGRQAISWGEGRFLNPIDLITPVGPFLLDIEDVPGADAVDLSYYINSFDMLEVVIVPYRRLDRSDTGRIGSLDTNLLFRYRASVGNLDLALIAGHHFHSAVAGIDMNWTIGGASIRAAYLARDERITKDDPYRNEQDPPPQTVHQALFGAGYAFFGELIMNVELFLNSGAYRDNAAVKEHITRAPLIDADFLPADPTDASFFHVQGRILTKNPVLIELSATYNITDLITMTLFAIGDPVGKSAYYGPIFSYSISDEGILSAGAQIMTDSRNSVEPEFPGYSDMAYGLIRWHF
jgi:hypothetical protein